MAAIYDDENIPIKYSENFLREYLLSSWEDHGHMFVDFYSCVTYHYVSCLTPTQLDNSE